MCNTEKEIWKTLLITHQRNSQVKDNKIDLLVQQYEQFVISEDESIGSVFARFNTIITSLKSLDEGYSSKNYVRKFLRALHPKWRAKVTAIEESKDLTSLSLNELIGNLKVHEMIIKKDSEIVKAKNDKKTFQRSLDDKNGRSNRRCFRCGDPNHLIGECPKPPKDKNQRAFVGGSWSDSGDKDDEKVNNETCLVAQASSEAAPKANIGPPPGTTPESEKSVSFKKSILGPRPKHIIVNNVRVPVASDNEICLGVDLEPDEWIKDSECSKHMTGNRKLFLSYKAYNGGNVIFGSNIRGNIIGKGTILNEYLKIDNVEHVDNLRFNLLSIGQICDNKCRVTFSEHDSEITKDGKVIGRGIRKKGLYVMKLGNKPKDQICLATIDENSTLWHKRLGHANMRLIQSLASKELVRNLPKLKFDQHFCDAWKIGKQAHASHKAKNIVSTTRFLELLHMDLFGPSAVRSYEGNRYTLVIVDDYSRYTWTRFLKDKTETLDQFEIFSKKIQNQLGCTIVSIRTDPCREFDNEVQFREFCNANGITHNFSALRTPQSNGMVERKNRTLQEMSRTMLNEQSLPQKFWCNAVDTSTYILNRILIRAILGKTTYELLRGRKPTLDDFRVFGSKCFILDTKDYLTKFDPKSYEGFFLGYSQNSKAYIILNKHTRKLEESLNVTFDETPPPSKTSPLVDDDLDEEEAIKVTEKKNLENDIVDETLEINEIVNIKESINHPLENVIGNLNQRTLRSQAQNQSNLFCFISTIEPKNVNEALTDDSWIVAMQEELNQFIANDVWELVPQPRNMTIIGTKWVFRNKLDENGIVSRNKARCLAMDVFACLLVLPCIGPIFREVMVAPIISISSDSSEESVPIVPANPLEFFTGCGTDLVASYTRFSIGFIINPQRTSSQILFAPSSEFPLAPIVAPPGIRRCSATLVRPGEAIPFGCTLPFRIDRITEIETTHKRLEAYKIEIGIDSIRWHMALSQEEFRQVRRDHDDTRRRLRRLESYILKPETTSDGDTGNGGNEDGGNGNGENGNGNPNENGRGVRPVARECTYQDFMKCQPLNFKGMKGVYCPREIPSQLMKLMAEVYCPRNEIQKMEFELWNLTVKNNDLAAYTQRFQELTMMCTKMVPEEEDQVEKFIRGLLDNIQGNGYAVKNAENKRRLEVNQRDNRGHQPPFKMPNVGGQNVDRAYTAGNNKRKPYNGPLPLCNKCKLHHEGPC
ncbi:retrovirus-related pol polyprotein from transposon TNT 1-94, partial [Tanacetum coccineum]